MKARVRVRIFKLSPIHASVIYQFHWIHWVPVLYRENSNVQVTWDSVLGGGSGSGAVVFSGGVDGVLAQTVHVVNVGFTVPATKNPICVSDISSQISDDNLKSSLWTCG